MNTCTHITLTANDGYALRASHFTASSDQFIVIASATAVPRGFYKRFAEFAQARGVNDITRKFADVTIPIAAVVSTDDLWAQPASRDAFFAGYRNAAVDRIDWRPHDLGVAQVGHMGYFRAAVGAALWPKMLAWLGQHGLRTS